MLKSVRNKFKACGFYVLFAHGLSRKHKKTTTRTNAKKAAGAKRINRKELKNNHKYVESRRSFRADTWMILILLILFGINGSLVSFVGYVTYQERDLLQRQNITKFPVPCDDISLSADEDFILFDVKKRDLKTFIDGNGEYICSKSNVTETVKTVVERKARFQLAKGLETLYLSCGNESLAEKSGYLNVFFTDILNHQNSSGVSSDTKLRWDIHSANCRIDPSVYYNDGEITIPEGRTYFVYATAHFNISQNENAGIKHFGRPHRFSIRICQSVYGYERTLLGRTVWFRNTTNADNVVSSLYIGSHLELSRNDKIYVRVSNANAMMSNSSGNNFGLFPL